MTSLVSRYLPDLLAFNNTKATETKDLKGFIQKGDMCDIWKAFLNACEKQLYQQFKT